MSPVQEFDLIAGRKNQLRISHEISGNNRISPAENDAERKGISYGLLRQQLLRRAHHHFRSRNHHLHQLRTQ